jgi:transcriptional regulator with XRE-family HTH domain
MPRAADNLGLQINRAFGATLRSVRLERRRSQEWLAFASGYHRTYISDLERVVYSPSVVTIFHLAQALGMTPMELVQRVYDLVDMSERNSGAG